MNEILNLIIKKNEKSVFLNDCKKSLDMNNENKQVSIINYLNWVS